MPFSVKRSKSVDKALIAKRVYIKVDGNDVLGDIQPYVHPSGCYYGLWFDRIDDWFPRSGRALLFESLNDAAEVAKYLSEVEWVKRRVK